MNKRASLLAFITSLTLLLFPRITFATHNRAGEITYEFIATNTIKATITTYTKESSVQADRDSLPIHWGDGSADDIVTRINGPICPSGTGVPCGESLGNDVKKNIYVAVHTYPGAPSPPNNFYVISMSDPNRNSDISNISNSVNVPFYLEDTIFYPTNIQNIGLNHSPLLLNPPIDFANVGDTFLHNPLAYDPDGDSLDFKQIQPLQGLGNPVPGYFDPHTVPYVPGDTETLDKHTGMYMWAVPQQTGIYNVAFLIREYRRGFLLSTIIRDMQIIVNADTNHPPHIVQVLDTCIRAGDRLTVNFSATDPDRNQTVTLSANGGPFVVPDSLSPATFTSNPGNPASGRMTWNTVCLDIRSQPYQVLVKATDNYSTPLVDLKTFDIQVIGPPPLDLHSNIVTKKVRLAWHQYLCEDIHTFRGFSIWKRIGSNPFTPDYCETGLAGRGYTMIANKVFDTTYVDQTAVGGQELCYRILAHFSRKSPNGQYEYDMVVSVPSNETCDSLPYDIPVITNVSVINTDQSLGRMDIEWTKPKAGGLDLDTIQDPPPYRFDLYRGTGFNFGAPALVSSVSRPSFASLIDTTYTDTLLNTLDTPYSYQVIFYSNNDTIGASSKASSVYLSLHPSDTKMRLTWSYAVPWIQDTFQIFRRDTTSTVFHYVGTSSAPLFVDTGLLNDSTYCYYVSAFGHYTSSFIKKPLINNSEIKCGVPIDTIPPCPPMVNVTNNCTVPAQDTFYYINNLTWQNFTDSCAFNTVKYRIYYAPDSGALTLIDSVIGINNTSYNHVLNFNLAGCYVVTAVDKRGNESYKVNRVCIDDCPNYELPNTFTPNGDGQNDLFTPRHPYRFITRVDFKVFTRWGEKVFETTDPELKWDGKDQKSGKELVDGVYLYAGYYYEQTLRGEVRKPLPQKNGGGFIHLIRGGK
jgi:gliding motility-associated-like protein